MPVTDTLPAEFRTNASLAAAWARFAVQQRLVERAIQTALSNSDESLPIKLASGELVGQVIARQYADHYSRVSWTVMSFDTQNDGLGATVNHFDHHGGWMGADARILPEGIMAFDAHGAPGHIYLALHETAHTTPLGVAMNQQCWDNHRRETSDIPWGQSNPWWLRNEKTANNIMRVIAERLDLPFLQNPGASFDAETGDPDLLYLDLLAQLDCGCGGGSIPPFPPTAS